MIKKYNVIDMSFIYRVASNTMFLVLSEQRTLTGMGKRIKVASKRFLDLDYKEDEQVCVLVWNEVVKMFDIIEVLYCDGIYDMYRTLLKVGINPTLAFCKGWSYFKRDFYQYTESIVISKHAMIKEKDEFCMCWKIIPNKPIMIVGTKMYLRHVTSNENIQRKDDDLFDKCLRGQPIKATDFQPLIDNKTKSLDLCLDFGNLIFNIGRDTVRIDRILGSGLNGKERVSFRFTMERIMFPSLFLSFILKAESEGRLLERINEYFIDVR